MSNGYTLIVTAKDVTEEILEVVRSIESGWYNDAPIDWDDVWERMEGLQLDDGTKLDLGPEQNSPAMQKMQRTIRAERRAS